MQTSPSAVELEPAKPGRIGVVSFETVNRFRSGRGRVLRKLIEALANHLGRDITVLDVGGRPDYWPNVGLGCVARIELMNTDRAELDRPLAPGLPETLFVRRIGDARDLGAHADGSVDLVHANSVIEHVGGWGDMAAMARELMRVGRAGWVQTPAWEFPFEPHFRVPFAHWFGRPLQARAMTLSLVKGYRDADLAARRRHVERVNLLSRRELGALFPGRAVHVERLVIAKSYSVYWLPEGMNGEMDGGT